MSEAKSNVLAFEKAKEAMAATKQLQLSPWQLALVCGVDIACNALAVVQVNICQPWKVDEASNRYCEEMKGELQKAMEYLNKWKLKFLSDSQNRVILAVASELPPPPPQGIV